MADDRTAARRQLIAERASTIERIAALAADIDVISAATESVATDDEHDPEGSIIAFERSQLEALRDQGRRRLAKLDAALRSIDEGTYGRCRHCGRAIAAERLAARPGADTCIDCARL